MRRVYYMKYVMIYTSFTNYDEYIEESDDYIELCNSMVKMYDSMCDHDKHNIQEMYIIESVNPDIEAENHFDGNILCMLA